MYWLCYALNLSTHHSTDETYSLDQQQMEVNQLSKITTWVF
jgi:hypothetical protein